MNCDHTEVLVVDLEATCWERGQEPAGVKSEIIEVGICVLIPKTGEILNPTSILVKPVNSTVSEFCTSLTTLTQDQVDTGVSLAEACEQLIRDFHSPKYPWASFGNYDRDMFWKQCQEKNLKYPFSANHLNIKTLFSVMRFIKHGKGMSKAMKIEGIPLIGTHHRGIDDAYNIAKVLRNLLAGKDTIKVDRFSERQGFPVYDADVLKCRGQI